MTSDWLRSLVALGTAFAAVVAATVAIALVIIADTGARSAVGSAAPEASAPAAAGGPITEIGGALMVTGAREMVVTLDREAWSTGSYALAGDDARVFFGGSPATPDRIEIEALSFFLDPGDCDATPGDRHDPTGVAGFRFRCADIEDVRGNGTFTVEGTVGVSADVLGLRGDLPPSGGEVTVGDETLVFEYAWLNLNQFAGGGGQSFLYIPADDGGGLNFTYNFQTHALGLSGVDLPGGIGDVPDGACSTDLRPIGLLNPTTTVVEVHLSCTGVEVTGASSGTVPLEGTLMVDIMGYAPH